MTRISLLPFHYKTFEGIHCIGAQQLQGLGSNSAFNSLIPSETTSLLYNKNYRVIYQHSLYKRGGIVCGQSTALEAKKSGLYSQLCTETITVPWPNSLHWPVEKARNSRGYKLHRFKRWYSMCYPLVYCLSEVQSLSEFCIDTILGCG